MKSTVKLLALILIAALLLCGCKKREPQTDNPSSATSGTDTPASGEVNEPTTPTVLTRPNAQDDILLNSAECGTDLMVLGEIKGKNYSNYINQLESILDNYKYDISLAVYSLDNSKALFYNTEQGIFGACTVKAPYTLYACMEMDKGNGSLNETKVYEQKHYEPGTGDMQYSAVGTAFTIETMLNKSMSISDNVGYLMAVDRFGRDGYNSFIESLGCESLKIKPTVWSLKTKSRDLVVLWREMYYYFNSDVAHAEFLKNSCTNTADNYATAALSGIDYSHKQGHNRTGDWKSFSDAGIVYKGDTPYIIAVVTNTPGPTAEGKQVMADIINIVHNNLF